MIKQILGKVSGKKSKSSKNKDFSGTISPNSTSSSSKRNDYGSGNSRKLVNSDISAPLNPRFSSTEKNFRNGGHASVSYEALPSFREVPSSEKQNLFIKKVNMCCVIFDFTDPTKNLKEKEIKRQTLLELVDFVASSNVKFTESVMQEFVKMVSANLFRELTPQPRDSKVLDSYDVEEEEPSMDPAWPHLQIVYELLLRFIASPEADAKIAKKYIDHYFVLKLLDMFDSEDPREREYLKTILHRVYGKFMVHRPFIRKSINNIFYRFVLETEKHNGIAELLEILGSIINGFALPLKEEHKLFLSRSLIPLHKPKCLAMYHQQLSYCITQFVEKDCKLADMVIRGLLKYWPVTNSSKELMFLGELEEVLEATQQPEFHRCMVPLFKQIARCLNSSYFQSCVFPKFVSSSEEVRKASAEAERRIDAHVSACSQREDVYRVVKAFAAKGEWTSMELKRYTQFLVKDFERNGMNLTLTKREELQRLKAQIDELSMRYIRNLNDDNSFLLFDHSELLGLPLEFLKTLDKSENNKSKISLRSHHVSAVLDLCKVGATRKAVAVAYGRRCEANLPLLEKLVQLRHKSARLLGYTNCADFVTDRRMAMSSSKVFEFLEEISASLNDLASQELSLLKNAKKKEEGEIPFGIEDLPYYVKKVEEKQIDLDFEAVKQYFPVHLVQSGIFKVCQDLFGLRFEKVTDAEVWHSDVQLFSVFDLNSTDLLGYFYLDIYAREGKYGHTCVVPLQNGSLTNGSRQIPVALLIAQVKNEVGDNPAVLRFSEVLKLFHEFGHVVHHICNRTSFAKFSGLRLDPDFVEIPAQVLENWCYEEASLRLISGFHQDITKPLSDDVCKSLKRWRCSFSALKLKQEILYCLFDQIIHSTENVDIVALFKHLHPKVMLGLPMLEGTNPASSFPSSAIGSEAACYSHIWSQVFAADVYASKFRDNIFNQYVGMQFRNKVMAPGGSKEPIELLSDFLGREPSIQAFVNSKSESFNDASFR